MWQPIETAPKDGCAILIYPAWSKGKGYRCGEAYWKKLKTKSGWSCVWTWIPCKPTHWMPLPEPPEETQ